MNKNWNCCICTKSLAKEFPQGGDLRINVGTTTPEAVINFGYGSCFDEGVFQNLFDPKLNPKLRKWEETPHIVGWICDECIVQRNNLFKVRHLELNLEQLNSDCYRINKFVYSELKDHSLTKEQIKNFDDYQYYDEITSNERAEIQNQINSKGPISKELVEKLLIAFSNQEKIINELRENLITLANSF